ncbi:MAG TPA: hypothetical protein VFI34_08615 [Candidatus Limnocylindrales bacterium]|nr:hypothetical protein [Candidatus Limnocylindrales bacterium]
MSRLSLASRHDPYWDMDGKGAKQQRLRRRLLRYVTWALIIGILALTALHLPAIDPDYLLRGEGRPVMAAGLLGILGSAAMLALARIRRAAND